MFFAPIIKYYNIKNFIKFFQSNNYVLVNKPKNINEDYNHDNFKNDATGINLIFQKKTKKIKNFKGRLLKSVSQLKINYKDKIIIKTIKLFKKIDLKKIKKLSSKKKLYYCLKLYYIAEAFRMSKTLKQVKSFEDIKIKDINTKNKIHNYLYQTLLDLKNG